MGVTGVIEPRFKSGGSWNVAGVDGRLADAIWATPEFGSFDIGNVGAVAGSPDANWPEFES